MTGTAPLASECYVATDWPYSFRWEMVRAYPVISGVPDAREAGRVEIDDGFRCIMANRNLQATLFLAIEEVSPDEFPF